MHPSSQRLVSLFESIGRDDLAELYERHGVQHGDGPRALVAAIGKDGGSSIVNLFRPEGVPYLEVCQDVADEVGVKGMGEVTCELRIEQAVLDAVWTRWREKASPEEIALVEQLARAERSRALGGRAQAVAVRGAAVGVSAAVFARQFGSQLMWVVVRNIVLPRLGLIDAARMAWAGPAAVLGPIGWVVGGGLAVWEVDKPALRKTVPTVVQVASLRGWSKQAGGR